MHRLRTQLIAAFVVLSVVPLTAIVTFGYYTSERSSGVTKSSVA